MRYALVVTGPAGAGKSTFCNALLTHMNMSKRTAHIVNLDPAADPEGAEYAPSIDIRDLISLEDVMSELGYGPNGGLIYCFEYLLQNMDWFEEELGEYESDYLIIDCPGQIELYTHHPLLPQFASHLSRLGVRTCVTYLIESQFMEDKYKFFSGVMSAMSAMVNFEVPWINILTKMDLVNPKSDETGGPRNGPRLKRDVQRYLEPDPYLLEGPGSVQETNPKFHSLNRAIVQLIEDHPLVAFLPLDLTDSDSIEYVLSSIDFTMQYGEDEEPKEPADLDEGDFADEDM
ncbi:ATP-binding protein Fet5 [Exidia glandulosa HHB12029]|uniref:GPN-loop GTPase 3 n=1 Tax=Exidia glandulosa HHB12029 TaxID=1314781 RepID=A0A165QR82_EXIGL|nr:ATP-binding protein Fet5 [Exidia glandulosa HHB12029]